MVKEFLHDRGIPFTLRNLNTDAVARDEFVRAGYPLPPVTLIDGVAVIGYDPNRLDTLIDATLGGRT